MPGSGKGAFSRMARRMGIPVLACGDIIREEARRRGLAPTSANLGKLMFALREAEGPEVVAKRLLPKIDAHKSGVLVVEGGRSPEEVAALKKHYDVITVGIHSSPETRYLRLRSRGRSDDSLTRAAFDERDFREIKVGMEKALAVADIPIVNEGSLEEFKKNVTGLLLGLTKK